MSGLVRPVELIDRDRYPLHDRTLAAYVAALEPLRGAFREDGACVLRGFLRPEAVEAVRLECEWLAPLGYRDATPGFCMVTVAYDVFAPNSRLRSLFEWDEMTRFVADIADERSLFRSADPLGALNVGVMIDGDELDWHHSPADVVAALAVQRPEAGAEMETSGSTGGWARLDEPGSLLVFAGRRAQRRIARVSGATPRYEVLMSYESRANAMLSDAVKLARYGRLVAPRRRTD